MAPQFLYLSEVIELHADQIEQYGGTPGIRDLGLLQSAIAMPAAGAGGEYVHADLFEMGAAYLFHLVKNHPFVDGKKRVGTAAALVFLHLNGIVVDAPEADLAELVEGVAAGQVEKDLVTRYLRDHGTAP